MALDTDIFGAPAEAPRDSDIFKDLPKPERKPEPQAAPVPAPTMGERLTSMGVAGARGLLQGGPMGAIVGASSEGSKQFGDAVGRVAYGAGGKATDLAAEAGASPEVAAGLGYATNLTTQAIPTVLGGQVAKGIAPAMQSAGKWLMQSALKPTWEAHRTGQAVQAIDTMLKEGVNATKGGMDKLRSQINTLNDEIDAAISNSTAMISKGQVGTRLKETFERFKNQVTPEADLESIKKAWMQFRNHADLIGKQMIPVQKAQELKRGTYRVLADKYGEEGAAATEAQKALARGLKEEISAALPQVATANNRASDLLNALNVGERRVFMDPNRNPLNLALMAHNPSSFAMFMADKSALIKSLLARGLYSGSEQIPAAAARLGIGYAMMPQGLAPGQVPALDIMGLNPGALFTP